MKDYQLVSLKRSVTRLNFDLTKSNTRVRRRCLMSLGLIKNNGLLVSAFLPFKPHFKEKKVRLILNNPLINEFSGGVVTNKNALNSNSSFFEQEVSSVFMNAFLKNVRTQLESTVRFYFSELELVGLGYRLTIRSSTVRFKLGFSHVVVLSIPKHVWILKRKKKILFYSTNKQVLTGFIAVLLRLKRMSVYKVKGLKRKNQIFNLKPGKKRAK